MQETPGGAEEELRCALGQVMVRCLLRTWMCESGVPRERSGNTAIMLGLYGVCDLAQLALLQGTLGSLHCLDLSHTA